MMSIEETQIEIKSTSKLLQVLMLQTLASPLSVGIFRLSSNAPMLDAAAEFSTGPWHPERGWYGS